jgi:alpha-D-xyloside xylohydrolase
MGEAHTKGSPVIRPLFYEFPEDDLCWDIKDAYLYGSDLLVAPICHAHDMTREVYLPKGAVWTLAHTGDTYEGGQIVTIDAPLDTLPLFLRDGKQSYLTKLLG